MSSSIREGLAKSLDRVLVILVADVHLCHTPPRARANEPDWYQTMRRTLLQIKALQKRYLNIPVLCAGDLFDKWNPPVELVNFALREIDNWYGVPGQHDLPYHVLNDINRSAMGTLIEAGRFRYVEPGKPITIEGVAPVQVHGFPWGVDLTPLDDPFELQLEVALIHRYAWSCEANPSKGDDSTDYIAYSDRLKGYNVAVWGDNHSPFEGKFRHGCRVFNCGGLFRRRSNEKDHRPSVGLLLADGTVRRHYLDTKDDVFVEVREELPIVKNEGVREFMQELDAVDVDEDINFEDAIKLALEEVRNDVRQEIILAMENGR